MTTKKKAVKATKKKGSQDIPLSVIPERHTKTQYPVDFKTKAVERVNAGETCEAVARDMKIATGALLSKWVRQVAKGEPLTSKRGGSRAKSAPPTFAQGLRAALDRASAERDERLEAAAVIAEVDAGGKDGAELAKRLRAFKRPAAK